MMNCTKKLILSVAATFIFAANLYSQQQSAPAQDTVSTLSELAVIANAKQRNDLRVEPLSATVIKLGNIERKQISTLSDLANQTPNLYIPNYGSKMTSSIYIRGLGSRIDHSAIGLHVDNIPLLNKNGFDSDMWDIMRMEVLRGPQSTLYGRNTSGGIINIYTLSPMLYQGTRLSVGYGSGETFNVKGATYHKLSDKVAFSIGGNYLTSGGYFKNEYDGSECDWIDSGSGRFRFIYEPNERLSFDNSFMFAAVNQGGYAYSLYNPESGKLSDVNYNDESGYERTTISNGLSIKYKGDNLLFTSLTSWQFLDDKMTLDQDFTEKSMFTLQQAQKEHSVTQDFILQNKADNKYHWMTGMTLFYKGMEMDAPVRFKEDGINGLILDNINDMFQKMPAPMNTAKLAFKEPEFDLNSNFDLPVLGAALYHQSQFTAGRFTFTAGLRLDYEKAKISYLSNSMVDYIYTMTIQMSPMMPPREIKVESGVESKLEDELQNEYFEVLPKFAIQYSLKDKGNLYASVTRGFKAGGYNTQMFSDILQNQVKGDLMADLMKNAGGSLGSMGGAMGGGSGAPSTGESYTVDEIITYKPEYSWNYEIGGHLNFAEGKVVADAALFYIDCTDQQLTVFPDGTTTGRMMTNAGSTRSVGGELSIQVQAAPGLVLSGAYGHTNAKFVNYNNGITDYKDKYVPYVPQNTLSANASYTIYKLGNLLDRLSFRVGYNGNGKIYWNEENTLSQDFFSMINASIFAEKGVLSFELWGKNLTDTDYNAFYFVSVGNAFFSKGRPAEWGATLSLSF